MSERDLAEAIHAEIIRAGSIDTALRIWEELAVVHPKWDRHQRMRFVLASVASDAIDAVLARRQNEAARDMVELTEPLTGDSKILDRRTGRIVTTRRRGEP